MARMTVDPAYSALVHGDDPQTRSERFAAQERAMIHLANAWTVRRGSLLNDLPWARRLGTSPWGAAEVLCRGTGVDYRVDQLRTRPPEAVTELLLRAAAPHAPALLYVGGALLPRHVTLLTNRDDETLVYEPARGVVLPFRAGSMDTGSLSLGGWNTAWLLVAPAAHFSWSSATRPGREVPPLGAPIRFVDNSEHAALGRWVG